MTYFLQYTQYSPVMLYRVTWKWKVPLSTHFKSYFKKTRCYFQLSDITSNRISCKYVRSLKWPSSPTVRTGTLLAHMNEICSSPAFSFFVFLPSSHIEYSTTHTLNRPLASVLCHACSIRTASQLPILPHSKQRKTGNTRSQITVIIWSEQE